MEAKDTVLQIPVTSGHQFVICDHCAYRVAQAEHSFKKGIREVVEWIRVAIPEDNWGKAHRVVYLTLDEEVWQAKLKEWGI